MSDAPLGEITLQSVPLPADSNANGDIFGGWLMSQMDLGASVPRCLGASVLARRRAHGRVATVAVDAMQFLKPVKIGDVVAIHALMQREGRSSMRIGVEVWVTRVPEDRIIKVTEAVFTFVAIDEAGRSRSLP